jgi:tRNA-specific 2-thiouridylase
VNEYAAGRTPNPDVLCNKEIKFDAFKKVAESLGAEAIATGHYATVKDGKLYRGKDNGKDQSYFLYTLDGSQLENVMMPLGQMVKSEVRKEAVRFGLPTASKKDSQGICFIGHLNLKDFLEGEIGSSPGEVRLLGEDVSEAERIGSSQRVGEHKGSAFYTVGEKMGPYIDNRLFSKVTGINQIPPLFLAHKDAQTNVVYVTPNREDSFLLRRIFKLEKAVLTGSRNETSLVDTIAILRSKTLEAQVRYQQDPVSVKEVFEEDGSIMIELSKPVWGAATGQSLVLFSENNVVGGGVVCATR